MTKLNIAIGKSRFDTHWKNKTMTWPELLNRLRDTTRTYETVAEYKAMKKDDQGRIKDIGCLLYTSQALSLLKEVSVFKLYYIKMEKRTTHA